MLLLMSVERRGTQAVTPLTPATQRRKSPSVGDVTEACRASSQRLALGSGSSPCLDTLEVFGEAVVQQYLAPVLLTVRLH